MSTLVRPCLLVQTFLVFDTPAASKDFSVQTPNTFGQALRQDRLSSNKTLSELALDLDIPLPQLRSWEADVTRPRIRKLEQLITYFGPKSMLAQHGRRLFELAQTDHAEDDGEPMRPIVPPAYLPIRFYEDCMQLLGSCVPPRLLYARHRIRCRRLIVRTPSERLMSRAQALAQALEAQKAFEQSFDDFSKALAWAVELEQNDLTRQ
jgi:transcriptional regulator with XRE-family HTH domain